MNAVYKKPDKFCEVLHTSTGKGDATLSLKL